MLKFIAGYSDRAVAIYVESELARRCIWAQSSTPYTQTIANNTDAGDRHGGRRDHGIKPADRRKRNGQHVVEEGPEQVSA